VRSTSVQQVPPHHNRSNWQRRLEFDGSRRLEELGGQERLGRVASGGLVEGDEVGRRQARPGEGLRALPVVAALKRPALPQVRFAQCDFVVVEHGHAYLQQGHWSISRYGVCVDGSRNRCGAPTERIPIQPLVIVSIGNTNLVFIKRWVVLHVCIATNDMDS